MTAENANIYYNKSVDVITLSTMRGRNTVEKNYHPNDREYQNIIKVLDLADAIPNPVGALTEELNLEKKKTNKLEGEKRDLNAQNENLRSEKERLNQLIADQNKKIARLLTGSVDAEATKGLISLYPDWQAGLAVDAGDAYRIGDVLYIAKKDHVTSDDNRPDKDKEAAFWQGGTNTPKTPDAGTGFKYPKGTEAEYQGVLYYALKDTNQGPEAGYPTWDLAENKPSGV